MNNYLSQSWTLVRAPIQSSDSDSGLGLGLVQIESGSQKIQTLSCVYFTTNCCLVSGNA